jgi:hypothetical protein
MTVGMSSPIDNEVERGVLMQLEAAGGLAKLCAPCLRAAVQVDRRRLMAAIRRLMLRRLIDAQKNRWTRCGEVDLLLQRRPAPASPC